ncbi:hypothetical protein QCA50_015136 [Cerrena zonata]|uniref:Taste receptor type 2 n=1 Tax=Cerrena zonata TaxID=2478898 RepID=A0AAW0FU53_9APHY
MGEILGTLSSCIQMQNPDISGIGVRISFYLQVVFLALLVFFSQEDTISVLWTFIMMNFGLTLAAVVQAFNRQLSLFQALQITNLLWLGNITFVATIQHYLFCNTTDDKNTHSWTSLVFRRTTLIHFLVALAQLLFSAAFAFYVWFSVTTFGNRVACVESIVYVIFFKSVPATNRAMRKTALVMVVVTTTGLVCCLSPWIPRRMRLATGTLRRATDMVADTVRKRRKKLIKKLVDMTVAIGLLAPPWLWWLVFPSIFCAVCFYVCLFLLSRWLARDNNLSWVILGSVVMCLCIYFIASTELLFRRNMVDNINQDWGFGQIVALVAVVPSFISILQTFLKRK